MSNTLRIAQITIPTEDNEGQPLTFVHLALKRELATSFGGYTSFETGGGWIDPETKKLVEEDGTTYQVAFPLERMGEIVSLAHQAGRMAKQKAVFYVIDGFASIDTLEG